MKNTKLSGVGLLLAQTYRSRAYVQMLVARKLQPDFIILLPDNEPIWSGADNLVLNEFNFIFRPGEAVIDTIKKNSWDYTILDNNDINSPNIIRKIERSPADVFVYSGKSGVLLKTEILSLSKKFLHVHGGYLPKYKGSTAFYYSLLRENTLGASAIWLDHGIDTGNIIWRENFKPTKRIEIDRIYDPVLRSHVLARVFEYKLEKNAFPPAEKNYTGDTYFVIHPVLKSLALKKLHYLK